MKNKSFNSIEDKKSDISFETDRFIIDKIPRSVEYFILIEISVAALKI